MSTSASMTSPASSPVTTAIYSSWVTLTDLLMRLLNESGYEAMMRLQGDEERLNNLAELKQSIHGYETTAGEEVTLANYLDRIAFLTGEDHSAARNTVKMMTIHSAKGLEFPFVFVCGLNEGIFPSRNTRTPQQMEEERRLAFVAMTRAEIGLFLSDAEGIHFDQSFRHPSRFIFNIGRENLEYLVELDAGLVDTTTRLVQRREANQTRQFDPGDTVLHPALGMGQIISVNEEEYSYSIKFERFATERSMRFGSPLTRV